MELWQTEDAVDWRYGWLWTCAGVCCLEPMPGCAKAAALRCVGGQITGRGKSVSNDETLYSCTEGHLV